MRSVPPEPDSPFGADIPGCDAWDGYWTRDYAVTEAMAWLDKSQPDAEQLVDEHGPAVIEIIRGSR